MSTILTTEIPAAPSLFRNALELTAKPKFVHWIVKDILPTETFGVMFGPSGTAKTFLMLDMLGAVACGIDWHGHRTQQGLVAYLCGEGGNAIGRRLAAWEQHHGESLDGRLFVATRIPPLLDGGDETIIRELKLLPATPSVVCLDTLSRGMGSGDENSSKDMRAVVDACDRIRAAFPGMSLILVHHSGWSASDRGRGSSVLKGALDFEMRVARAADGEVTLACTKAKDFEEPADFRFALERIDLSWVDEDGRALSSLVPLMVGAGRREAKGLGKHQRTVMDVLQRLYSEHDQTLADNHSVTNAPAPTFDEWQVACQSEMVGVKRFSERFREASGALIKSGHVQVLDGFVYINVGTSIDAH